MDSFTIRNSTGFVALLLAVAACGDESGVSGKVSGAGGQSGGAMGAGGQSGSSTTEPETGGGVVQVVDASSGGGGGSEGVTEAGPQPIVDAGVDWGVMDPGTKGDGDFTIGPNPPAHPDVSMK